MHGGDADVDDVMPQQGELQVGELLGGRYEIDEHLATGQQTGTYEAVDRVIGRRVAVKLLEAPPDNEAVQAFRVRARAMADLNSVHTATLFDVGEHEGGPFLVFELLHGRTLDDLLARLKKKHRKLGPEPAAEVAAAVLRSLAEAHDHKLIHGGIEPSDVVLARTGSGELTVKLIGYGGSVSAAYMSPEQVQSTRLDGRADLYSLGVLLYRCMSGRAPHEHADDYHVMAMHMQVEPDALELPGERGPALARFVHRLLAKQPGQRHRTALDALVALQAISGRRLHAVPHLASLDDELGETRSEHLVDASGNPNDFLDAKTSLYGISPLSRVGPAKEVGEPAGREDKITRTSGKTTQHS